MHLKTMKNQNRMTFIFNSGDKEGSRLGAQSDCHHGSRRGVGNHHSKESRL